MNKLRVIKLDMKIYLRNEEGKIFFSYDGQDGEFELPIDLAKGEVTYGTLVYKKE
jgi:hypothetical protein